MTLYMYQADLWTADALSRAPQATQSEADLLFQEETDIYMCSVVDSLPATPTRLDQIRIQQEGDEVCQTLVHYSNKGWPTKSQLPAAVQQYWQYRGELSVNKGLLMKGSRLYIPSSLRVEMLSRLHEGHQGIVRTRSRACQAIWWPGISKEVEDMVKNCIVCVREQRPRTEALCPMPPA